jgi:hypothetical protein
VSIKEFENMTDKLVAELQSAHMHFEIYKEIKKQISVHSKEMNESKHFWSLTINAHLESTRSTLVRIYDQNEKNLGIKSWLLEFKKNYRKQDFFESKELDNFSRIPLKNGEIGSDLKRISSEDKIVNVLYKRHRHTEIAHMSLSNAKKGVSYFEEYPLTCSVIQELIDRASTIINKYSSHHNGRNYAMTTVDNKDYEYIFERLSKP